MTADRCKCSHRRWQHRTIADGAVYCVYPCGCTEFRPDDGERWTPARFREGDSYDPDGPVDRRVS